MHQSLQRVETYPLPLAVFGVCAYDCSNWLHEAACGGELVCGTNTVCLESSKVVFLYYAWYGGAGN